MKRFLALALGLCLFASPALAAWSVTQVTSGTAQNAGAATLATSNISISAGHLAVVTGFVRGNTMSSVSDAAGNTWTLITPCQLAAQGHYVWTAYSVLTNAISAAKITANFGGVATAASLSVWDITGQHSGAAPEDTAAHNCNSNTSTTTSPTVTSGTPTQAGDLFISTWGFAATASGLSYTASGSWLPAGGWGTGNTSVGSISTYLDATGSSSTQTSNPTTTSKPYASNIVSFSPAAAAGSTKCGALAATGAGC